MAEKLNRKQKKLLEAEQKRRLELSIWNPLQAEEFVNEYSQIAIVPGEQKGPTTSSSPGQSMHREKEF